MAAVLALPSLLVAGVSVGLGRPCRPDEIKQWGCTSSWVEPSGQLQEAQQALKVVADPSPLPEVKEACVSISEGITDEWCTNTCSQGTGEYCNPQNCKCGAEAEAELNNPKRETGGSVAAPAATTPAPAAAPVATTPVPISAAIPEDPRAATGIRPESEPIATAVPAPTLDPKLEDWTSNRPTENVCDFDVVACITTTLNGTVVERPVDGPTGEHESTSDCRNCRDHINWCRNTLHTDANNRPVPVSLEQCMDEVADQAVECTPAGCRYACSVCQTNESKAFMRAVLGLPMDEPSSPSNAQQAAEVADAAIDQTDNQKKAAAAKAAEARRRAQQQAAEATSAQIKQHDEATQAAADAAARKAKEAQEARDAAAPDKTAADTAVTGAVPTPAATGPVDQVDAEQKIKDDIERRAAEIAAAGEKEEEERAEEEKKRQEAAGEGLADANKAAADAAKAAEADAKKAAAEANEAAAAAASPICLDRSAVTPAHPCPRASPVPLASPLPWAWPLASPSPSPAPLPRCPRWWASSPRQPCSSGSESGGQE